MFNYGQVIIANGGIILDGGTFSNSGILGFVSFDAGTYSFNDSDTIEFSLNNNISEIVVTADVRENSLTPEHLKTNLATDGYVLSVDSIGDFKWVDINSSLSAISGSQGYVPLFIGTSSLSNSIIRQNLDIIEVLGNLSLGSGNTVKIKADNINSNYELNLPSGQGSNGSVLVNDGSGNLYWSLSAGGSGGGIVKNIDKNFIIATTSIGNNFETNVSISETPIDNSYVALFINGQEFLVSENTNDVAYFSGDGGVSARGFSPTHINGAVQIGDKLYWNGDNIGMNLEVGWRVSLFYLT
jgi:hypothetical protein